MNEKDRPAARRARSSEPRSRQLQIRLSEREFEAVSVAAEVSGLSRGAWAAATVQASIDRHRDPLASVELRAAMGELSAARLELVRVGTNLNQLAKKANEGAPVAVGVLESMHADLVAAVVAVDDAAAGLGSAARAKR